MKSPEQHYAEWCSGDEKPLIDLIRDVQEGALGVAHSALRNIEKRVEELECESAQINRNLQYEITSRAWDEQDVTSRLRLLESTQARHVKTLEFIEYERVQPLEARVASLEAAVRNIAAHDDDICARIARLEREVGACMDALWTPTEREPTTKTSATVPTKSERVMLNTGEGNATAGQAAASNLSPAARSDSPSGRTDGKAHDDASRTIRPSPALSLAAWLRTHAEGATFTADAKRLREAADVVERARTVLANLPKD